MSSVEAIDLFCGAGGTSTGLQQAGCKVTAGFDIEKKCGPTFKHNHPGAEFICADLRDLDPRDFKGASVVIGGPPCQPFSQAKRDPDPEKGMELVNEFYRWVEVIQPKWWFMENVPGVLSHLDGRWPVRTLLNAADFGVPQKRLRCFSGKFVVPATTHVYRKAGQTSLFNFKPSWVTLWNGIKDLLWVVQEGIETSIPNLEAMNSSQATLRKKLLEHDFGMQKRNGSLDFNRPSHSVTDMHGDSFIVPRELLVSDRFLNNNSWSPFYDGMVRPSRTVTTIAQYILYREEVTGEIVQLRRLTVRENARLQGFPDSFPFLGTKSANFRMVGNAVCPAVARHIALANNGGNGN